MGCVNGVNSDAQRAVPPPDIVGYFVGCSLKAFPQ